MTPPDRGNNDDVNCPDDADDDGENSPDDKNGDGENSPADGTGEDSPADDTSGNGDTGPENGDTAPENGDTGSENGDTGSENGDTDGDEQPESDRDSLQDEIEEILRGQGEEPVTRRPPRHEMVPSGTGPGMEMFNRGRQLLDTTPVARYVVAGALVIGLTFLAFRVLGPVATRLALFALVAFLLFYVLRALLTEILRRRR